MGIKIVEGKIVSRFFLGIKTIVIRRVFAEKKSRQCDKNETYLFFCVVEHTKIT